MFKKLLKVGRDVRANASSSGGTTGEKSSPQKNRRGSAGKSSVDLVAGIDLSLEPALNEAVEKLLKFERVLETLLRDVEKFKDMVQDICFQTTVLSEAFRTVFRRAEDNDAIYDHHERATVVANSIRGDFETRLNKRVLNPLKKQMSQNRDALGDVLTWHNALQEFISQQHKSKGADEISQRIGEVDLQSRARDVTESLDAIYKQRFFMLRKVFDNFQSIQKRWFVATGNTLVTPKQCTLLNRTRDNADEGSGEWMGKFPLIIFTFFTAAETLVLNLVCKDWNDRALRGCSMACAKLLHARLLYMLTRSKSVQNEIRRAWAAPSRRISTVPVAPSEVGSNELHALDTMGGVINTYASLLGTMNESVDPALQSVFDTIERDVQRTYGNEHKRVAVHGDEEDNLPWESHSYGYKTTSLTTTENDVERMIGAALGVDADVDIALEETTWNLPTTKVCRASEDDGLLLEEDALIRAKGKLRRVLCAFAVIDRDVSYCQGMNFIGRALLKLSKDDEGTAFGLLVSLFQNYGFEQLMSVDMKRAKICFFQLDTLIQVHLPLLYQHFQNEDVACQMFSSSWFMTLFTKNDVLPPYLSLSVLQRFFTEGWPILFSVALAILASLERMLLARDFEGIVKCLQDSQSKISKTFPTEQLLYQKAQTLRVTAKKLRRLEEIFNEQAVMRTRRTMSLS
jgi:hypothetical protein